MFDYRVDSTEISAVPSTLLSYLERCAYRDSICSSSSSNNEFVPTDILWRAIQLLPSSHSDAHTFCQDIANAFADFHDPVTLYCISCGLPLICLFLHRFIIAAAQANDTAHSPALIAHHDSIHNIHSLYLFSGDDLSDCRTRQLFILQLEHVEDEDPQHTLPLQAEITSLSHILLLPSWPSHLHSTSLHAAQLFIQQNRMMYCTPTNTSVVFSLSLELRCVNRNDSKCFLFFFSCQSDNLSSAVHTHCSLFAQWHHDLLFSSHPT